MSTSTAPQSCYSPFYAEPSTPCTVDSSNEKHPSIEQGVTHVTTSPPQATPSVLDATELHQPTSCNKSIYVLQGYGVIGSTDDGPEEIEHAPSLSLTLASLPGVHVSIQHVTKEQLPDGGEHR